MQRQQPLIDSQKCGVSSCAVCQVQLYDWGSFNTSSPDQNGRRFADDIFNYIFNEWKV